VLPAYSARELQKALAALEDRSVRSAMAANAGRFGRNFLNWENGEEILYREYSALMPGALREPSTEPRLECMQAWGVGK
jgi:hypothetical protein